MGRAIGIDLGTTNSCAAFVDNGKPKVITYRDGSRTIPSMFAIDKKENKVVIQIENPSEEQMKGVGLAVEHCPTRALALEKN